MSKEARRRIEVEDVGEVAVVAFLDKRILDEQNIQLIGEQLEELVDNEEREKILLDFGNVEYLSSAALGRLIKLNKKVRGVNGQLKLCNVKPEIYEVFEITRLNQVLGIYPSQEKAISAFK